MNNRILIVYFSGTGGTKRIADAFEENFIQKKLDVTKHSLEKVEYELFKDKYIDLFKDIKMIVLIYPVYATEAPISVYEWIENLPVGFNMPTILISVSGGGDVWPNTSCRVNVIKALEKKKYRVFYEKMMVMPSNFYLEVNDHVAMHLLKRIPEKVNKIVNDILEGKIRRDRIHISTRIFSLLHTEKEIKSIKKSLRIKDNCSGCGWCASNCPRENIKMKNGTPEFEDACVACFRCIYGCPNKSIYLVKGNRIILKEGFNIEEVEKRMQNTPLEPIEKCCKGLLLIGIKKYLLEKE